MASALAASVGSPMRVGARAPSRATARRASVGAGPVRPAVSTLGRAAIASSARPRLARRGDVSGPRAAFLSPFGANTLEATEETAESSGDSGSSAERRRKRLLRLKIDGEWYDCTGWAKAHPGGSLFITLMDGCDATDVFYALHSYGPNGDDTAARRLAMLPRCQGPEDDEEAFVGHAERMPRPENSPHTFAEYSAPADAKFAELRSKFEREGWFARDPLKEAAVLATTLGLYALGWILAANAHPWLAALSLGLGMQQAGWLAHDYIHGRGRWCGFMRGFGSLTNGFSTEWWQHKHNMHHSFTNIDGRDGDIKLEPLYFLQDPKETGRPDNPTLRRWQHWYGYPLYAFTYALWRRHSLASAIERRDTKELGLLAIHYAWLFTCLPLGVALGSILIGGFLVGALVTATHQTEEIMFEQNTQFVDAQFRSTREADVSSGFEKFLWGGMDTQLVHHLFPTMPRYRHHAAREVIQKWAAEHGYDFRISSSAEILGKNFNHLKALAHI